MEKNQKQQQFQDTNPIFRRECETEEIVPGVPIIRSSTPRPSSFDAMLSSTGYRQKSQHSDSFAMGTFGL